MIAFIIILTLIILTCKHIYEIHNFNHNAVLQQIQSANSTEITELIKERSPLVIHNLGTKSESMNEDITLQSLNAMNPGYIISDNGKNVALSSFSSEDVNQMSVYRNNKMTKDLNVEGIYDTIYKPFSGNLHCNVTNSMSLFKGSNAITLTINKHNLLLIHQIQGKCNLYLFNPKHREDILGLENNAIKKYGQKLSVEEGLVIYIPPEWYYFYETEGECIIGEIQCDNYFTVIYNTLR